MSDATQLLTDAGQGDPGAAEELLVVVYDELRRLAAHKMSKESPGHTLQPTALIGEAWLRLADSKETPTTFVDRRHFLATVARTMRSGASELACAPIRIPGMEPISRVASSAQLTLPKSRCPMPASKVRGIACTMSVPTKVAAVSRRG